MPLLGGLAILAGALLAGLLFLPVGIETRGILVGAGLAALVGAVDDILDLPAPAKLVGQAVAAAVPVLSEVRVENVTLPLVGPLDFGPVPGGALTLLGIVAVMNVVNFSDGVDGLAAGVCTIAGVTFAAIALSSTASTRASSPASPPARRSASWRTTSIPRRSSWATRVRACSGSCLPAWPSRGA